MDVIWHGFLYHATTIQSKMTKYGFIHLVFIFKSQVYWTKMHLINIGIRIMIAIHFLLLPKQQSINDFYFWISNKLSMIHWRKLWFLICVFYSLVSIYKLFFSHHIMDSGKLHSTFINLYAINYIKKIIAIIIIINSFSNNILWRFDFRQLIWFSFLGTQIACCFHISILLTIFNIIFCYSILCFDKIRKGLLLVKTISN